MLCSHFFIWIMNNNILKSVILLGILNLCTNMQSYTTSLKLHFTNTSWCKLFTKLLGAGSYSVSLCCQLEETPSACPHTYLSTLTGAMWVCPTVAALFFLCSSHSLLFHSSFLGNWLWVLKVGSKRMGWSCWELCSCVCVSVSVCAGKWANKGQWSMKGLEQRHSQLPNAWTWLQGPMLTRSLTNNRVHTHPCIHLIYVYM